jgi:H+/gluconate symporter-like permease
MIMALLVGIATILMAMILNGLMGQIPTALNSGAAASLLPTFNTASEVGYGATIAALSGFAFIRDGIFSFAPSNPLVAEMISVNVLSGITGSASGGLSIALGALGDQFLSMGNRAGISPEVMHRVASLSSGGLDSLPHNGAVITILTVCGLTHKESYKDIGVVSLIIPILVTVSCVSVGLMLGLFV